MSKVDIYSKGEVVRYLQGLQEQGQIKDCIHIKVEQGHAYAFYPKCDIDWASRKSAYNVDISITGYGGPSSYEWPQCPEDCEFYERADAFVKSMVTIKTAKAEKPQVDIHSRDEVTDYVLKLLGKGQIRDCQHMKVKKDLVDSYYPQCDVDLASKQAAFSLGPILKHGGQDEYYWPGCGKDCRVYKKADDFVKSLISIEEPKVEKLEGDNYVAEERIKAIASLPKDKFDTARLVKLCDELNKSYKNSCELAVAAMVRTILNHVPPIFEMENFEQVANNYSWGRGKLKGKSKREVMIALEDTARNIADIHLHQEIRDTESLPTMTQVDFKNELDILLEEVVRILKSQAKSKKSA